MKYYVRYCDDGCILHSNKDVLNMLLGEVETYLTKNLQLELNPKTQIFPVDVRGIDFLGYRCFRNYTLLRKSSAKRMKKKIQLIEKYHEMMKPQHIISSIMSYYGWMNFCNCHHLRERYIMRNKEIVTIMDEASEKEGITNPLLRINTIGGEK